MPVFGKIGQQIFKKINAKTQNREGARLQT
jgi:hypothetical protein